MWCARYNEAVTDDSTVSSAPSTAAPGLPAASHIPVATVAASAGPSHARLWIVGAFVFGALAVASLVSAWHTQQRVRALEEQLVRRQQTSQEDATEARLLAKQAIDAVREAQGKIGVLDERVAESALQRSQVEDLIQSLSRSRDENVLADVDASLRVALQQAALTGSPEPIAAALRQADERLARLDNPRLERVRRAIARDIDRVRNASVVDVPVLTMRLDEAVRMVDELPLATTPERAGALRGASGAALASSGAASIATPPARGGSSGANRVASSGRASEASGAASEAEDSEAEWIQSMRRAWERFSTPFFGELRQAVRVTSIQHPEAMLMTPEQGVFLRENVKLRLLNARLSLLSRQFDLAQADLQQAQGALDRYFDRSSRRVTAVGDLLRQVSTQARQVTFPRPDDTLAAVAAAAAAK
jgi:uroporphyrin-3 C-methyltransferase